ncbi:hypothetical protein N8D56_18805 [Devosia sp. A8/3-2]|nr:hypothetical protein N8D56_18805 [Devosia sp. A8/3-2]
MTELPSLWITGRSCANLVALSFGNRGASRGYGKTHGLRASDPSSWAPDPVRHGEIATAAGELKLGIAIVKIGDRRATGLKYPFSRQGTGRKQAEQSTKRFQHERFLIGSDGFGEHTADTAPPIVGHSR